MLYIDSVVGINQIEPDTTIIRVFRRDKYEKLFKNKSIWFSKIDEIMGNCDELERTIPKSFFCTMTAEQREYYERCNAAKDSVYKSFVSCWSKRECDELWKNYDPESSGFAVVTTVGKLYNEFDKNSVISLGIAVILSLLVHVIIGIGVGIFGVFATAALITKQDRTNLSIVDYVKLIIRKNKEQQNFAYKYKDDYGLM